MTERLSNDPHYWEARALQARSVAEEAPDRVTRARILKIARHYEVIAEQAVHKLKARAASRMPTAR